MTDNANQPKAGRPKFPNDYGIPEHNESLLPWSYVEEHMLRARNYWIVTVTPNCRPAATPVWGVWVEGRLYFDGSPETRRGRNIQHNPHVVVHLESGDQVVILDGQAQVLSGAPERGLAEKVAAAYREKYAASGYAPQPEQWDQGGLFCFEPVSVMGWTQFPQDTTRWRVK